MLLFQVYHGEEQLFDAIRLLATALSVTLATGSGFYGNEDVSRAMRNLTFSSFYGNATTDNFANVIMTFTFWDYSPYENKFVPSFEVNPEIGETLSLRFHEHFAINWPNNQVLPPDVCDFEICKSNGKFKLLNL